MSSLSWRGSGSSARSCLKVSRRFQSCDEFFLLRGLFGLRSYAGTWVAENGSPDFKITVIRNSNRLATATIAFFARRRFLRRS